ncbi:hypothetical protein GQ42DRAFT_159023 [Ramicandelaber brevisporus]|nr:hypothetical protein GQ42DRAFT_159023 [Ramicandelaber brevisporus]
MTCEQALWKAAGACTRSLSRTPCCGGRSTRCSSDESDRDSEYCAKTMRRSSGGMTRPSPPDLHASTKLRPTAIAAITLSGKTLEHEALGSGDDADVVSAIDAVDAVDAVDAAVDDAAAAGLLGAWLELPSPNIVRNASTSSSRLPIASLPRTCVGRLGAIQVCLTVSRIVSLREAIFRRTGEENLERTCGSVEGSTGTAEDDAVEETESVDARL